MSGSYDAAATAALHDSTKMVFDFPFDHGIVPQILALFGGSIEGVTDLAGNPAMIGNVAASHAFDFHLLT
jgi:hypothetical protein